MLNNGYRYAKKAISKLYNYSLVPYGWTKSQIYRLIPKHSAEDYPIDFVVTWVAGEYNTTTLSAHLYEIDPETKKQKWQAAEDYWAKRRKELGFGEPEE